MKESNVFAFLPTIPDKLICRMQAKACMPWSMSTRHITPHEWPCHKWWRNWSYSLWLFDPKRSCQNYQIGLPNLLHLVGCRLRHVCPKMWVTNWKRKHFKSHYGINVKVIPFGFSVNNVLVKFSNRSAQSNTLAS